MNFVECFKSAIKNVLANKMRSLLTMLGIIIGISSVIIIVSIGNMGRDYMNGQFEGLGVNTLNIQLNGKPGEDLSRYYFKKDDVHTLLDKVPDVIDISPLIHGGLGASTNGSKSRDVSIAGTAPGYQKVSNVEMVKGRFLSDSDIEGEKNVVVIDETTAQKLFPLDEPIGAKLSLKSSNKSSSFTIIGISKNEDSAIANAFADSIPGTALIPYTVGDKILPKTDITSMAARYSETADSGEVSKKIVRTLENKHRVTDKYVAEDLLKGAGVDMIGNVIGIFTLVISVIAGISLLVGGIGVMNIMLVSVTERTREIGIRKALGAKKKDIKLQFLVESLIICLIGGTIGMIFGIAVSALIAIATGSGISISIGVILISFIFSSAIGVFFGIYPAGKAAKLNPIDALRYE